MIQSAYITDTAERERALEALARMKEMEAKRKRKMRTVRLDSRTIVCATKGVLQERLEKHKAESKPTKKAPTPRSIELRKQRMEVIESVFGRKKTMTRTFISKKLREEHGYTSARVAKFIKYALLDGDLTELAHDSTKDRKFAINKK